MVGTEFLLCDRCFGGEGPGSLGISSPGSPMPCGMGSRGGAPLATKPLDVSLSSLLSAGRKSAWVPWLEFVGVVAVAVVIGAVISGGVGDVRGCGWLRLVLFPS